MKLGISQNQRKRVNGDGKPGENMGPRGESKHVKEEEQMQHSFYARYIRKKNPCSCVPDQHSGPQPEHVRHLIYAFGGGKFLKRRGPSLIRQT